MVDFLGVWLTLKFWEKKLLPCKKNLIRRLRNCIRVLSRMFDLDRDIGETRDLREKLPETYNSLKREFIGFFENINADYPGAESAAAAAPAVSREDRLKLREERLKARNEKKKKPKADQ